MTGILKNFHVEILSAGGLLRPTIVLATVANVSGSVPGTYSFSQ